MDTSGFYKWEGGEMLFAPVSVGSATFSLFRDQRDTYTYPVEGWTWYDNMTVAMSAILNRESTRLDKLTEYVMSLPVPEGLELAAAEILTLT